MADDWEWTGVVLDRSTGVDVEQRVPIYSEHYTMPTQSTDGRFTPGQWDFAIPSTSNAYHLREDQEWWAGWRRRATGEWDSTRAVYGGYIGTQTGGARADRHTFAHDLDTYNVLLTGTRVIVWPPQDLSTEDKIYPPGWSLTQWLVGERAGGAPYDGVLRTHLAGSPIDWSGVDPLWDGMIFNLDGRPGNPDLVPGRWSFTTLDKALQDLAALVRKKDSSLNPVGYFEATVSRVDPTQILPRFRYIDMDHNAADSVATFSITPGAREWAILEPFEHGRNARRAKQRIVVKGVGEERDSTGVWREVYAEVYLDRPGLNPTKYQTDSGWAAEVIEDAQIVTLAQAAAIAAAVEARSYGAEGWLRFTTTRETQAGETVTLYIPQEGQDHTTKVVNSVRAHTDRGYPLFEITVGDPAIRLSDIITGVLMGTPHRGAR